MRSTLDSREVSATRVAGDVVISSCVLWAATLLTAASAQSSADETDDESGDESDEGESGSEEDEMESGEGEESEDAIE